MPLEQSEFLPALAVSFGESMLLSPSKQSHVVVSGLPKKKGTRPL
jgi:hypothetical protein